MIQVAQLFLSLAILIIFHELGHFIPAKLFKTRVNKFYLFFDFLFPVPTLLNFAIFKKKIGDTEYGLGWFPFGGYVQIAGMIDETTDKEALKLPPQPWEFRSKPSWQRLIIMIGGVTVNVILGILIYSMVLFTWGKTSLPLENVKYGVACDSLALKMGMQDGDNIVSVNGKPVESLNKVPVTIVLDRAESIQVERNGQQINIPIRNEDLGRMIKSKLSFVAARIPCEVDSIIPDMPAAKAGLLKGDKIISVESNPTAFYNEVQTQIRRNIGKTVSVNVLRGADTVSLTVPISQEGTIGFFNLPADKFLEFKKIEYGFFASIPAGINEAYEKIIMQFKQIAVLFEVKDAHQSLGGFYSLTKAFDPGWDWQVFWSFTAFLSIILAVMNFLPIPMLDGGYIMFLLFEMITRVKVPDKVIEYANYIGFALIIALMVYANTDWLRH